MENKQLNLDEIKSTQVEVIKMDAQKELKGGIENAIVNDDIILY